MTFLDYFVYWGFLGFIFTFALCCIMAENNYNPFNLSQFQLTIIGFILGPFVWTLFVSTLILMGIYYFFHKFPSFAKIPYKILKNIISPIPKFWAWAGTINFIKN